MRNSPANRIIARNYDLKAQNYMRNGDYDEAIRHCDEAIKIDPTFASAYTTRGRVYENNGDCDEAILNYEMALELDPNDSFASLRLSACNRRR